MYLLCLDGLLMGGEIRPRTFGHFSSGLCKTKRGKTLVFFFWEKYAAVYHPGHKSQNLKKKSFIFGLKCLAICSKNKGDFLLRKET